MDVVRWVQAACLALTLLAAPGAQAGPLDCLPDSGPNFASPRYPSLRSVVVLVHGLHGDARDTWLATGGGKPTAAWPCLILGDAENFAKSNVYVASYRSTAFAGNPNTTTAAKLLAAELRAATGVFGHAHVTLVAHSMGGLIVARMLTTPGLLTPDDRGRIRLVVFMGTPAQPTEAANACKHLRINEQCAEMSDGENMQKLWRAWDELADRPAAWCLAEGDNTWFPRWDWQFWSLRIVPPESAFRPCRATEGRWRIDGRDHSTLVKPEGDSTDPHRYLRVAFAACVESHLRDEKPVEPALTEGVATWYRALTARVAGDAPAAEGHLTESLEGVGTPGAAYWLPRDPGQPVSHRKELELKPAQWFVRELRNQAAMLFAEVRWVDRVASLRKRLADGKVEALTESMEGAGRLRPDDVVLAVDAGPSLRFLPLLVLRPQGAGYGLLGFFGVALRQPPDCSDKAPMSG